MPEGHYSLALNSSVYQSGVVYKTGIAMKLSYPLSVNHTYELGFYKRKQDSVIEDGRDSHALLVSPNPNPLESTIQ